MSYLSRYGILGRLVMMVVLAAALIPQTAGAEGAAPPTPDAAAGELRVTELNINARLSTAARLDITETILLSAAPAPATVKHTVPLTYHDDQGRKYPVGLHFGSADQDGRSLALTPQFNPAASTATFDLPVLTAATTITLRYALSPVVLRGQTADILSLPVSGLAWTVPLDRVQFRLEHASLTATGDVQCTTGSGGTTSGSCVITPEDHGLAVVTGAPLKPGEVLGVVTAFPHGSFSSYLKPAPGPTQAWWPVVAIVAALIVAVGFGIWLALVRVRRRDYTNAV